MGAAAETQAPGGQPGRGAGPAIAESFPEGMPRLLSALEPGALDARSGVSAEGQALMTQRFAFLESRKPEELAEILSAEQPEDLALVFAHLAESNPTQSALLFSGMAAPLQASVSAALANLRVALECK
jgi:flagellar motor switch protein FliG